MQKYGTGNLSKYCFSIEYYDALKLWTFYVILLLPELVMTLKFQASSIKAHMERTVIVEKYIL